jgi:hypothetical protein
VVGTRCARSLTNPFGRQSKIIQGHAQHIPTEI